MNWLKEKDKLIKEYKMQGFSDIVRRLNLLEDISNQIQHHPDFKVYNYRFIRFELTTHDSQQITDKDYLLAERIDELFS